MGFSTSAAAAIIGVAILISFEFMVANVIPTITDTHDSYDKMRDRAIDQVQTNINITDMSTIPSGANYHLNITLENTGSVTLKTDDFTILINGSVEQFTCSSPYIYLETEVYFNVSDLPGSGPRRLKVITQNGISDYGEYIVP